MRREPTFRDLYAMIQFLKTGDTNVYKGHKLSISVYDCRCRVNFDDRETGLGINNFIYNLPRYLGKVWIRKVVDGYQDDCTDTAIDIKEKMCDHIDELDRCSQGARGKEIIEVTREALRMFCKEF